MKKSDKVDKQSEKAVDLLLTRHPTVQAFVDKKIEQARESLKDIDLSKLRHERETAN